MQIVHVLNHFFYTIFPDLQGKSHEELVRTLEIYYSYGPYKPKVSVLNDTVTIELNKDKMLIQDGWSMAIPEMLASLQLPFDREYEIAKGMVKS
ncbi:MAG: hypothetical protein IT267_09650 [Saprospiraceae bacterium]|nr:hypothetical protein [Saprospiraceae bacterium]